MIAERVESMRPLVARAFGSSAPMSTAPQHGAPAASDLEARLAEIERRLGIRGAPAGHPAPYVVPPPAAPGAPRNSRAPSAPTPPCTPETPHSDHRGVYAPSVSQGEVSYRVDDQGQAYELPADAPDGFEIEYEHDSEDAAEGYEWVADFEPDEESPEEWAVAFDWPDEGTTADGTAWRIAPADFHSGQPASGAPESEATVRELTSLIRGMHEEVRALREELRGLRSEVQRSAFEGDGAIR
jgi:hypothetical protein